MFKCERCGSCCRNLIKSEIYAYLDRGDGTCKYLQRNICLIYDKRPLICRVDEGYKEIFKNMMTIEEYYKINKQVCKKLRKMEGK